MVRTLVSRAVTLAVAGMVPVTLAVVGLVLMVVMMGVGVMGMVLLLVVSSLQTGEQLQQGLSGQ